METRSTGYILVALQSCVETTLPTDFFYIAKKKREKKGSGGGGEKEGSESIVYNVIGIIPPVNTKTCFTGI